MVEVTVKNGEQLERALRRFKKKWEVPVFYVKSNENHTISNQAMSSAQLRKKQCADGYVLQGMNNKFFA